MAEYCLKCFNELNGTDYRPNEVWLEEDFCEGCGDWRLCVMEFRHKRLLRQLFALFRELLRS